MLDRCTDIIEPESPHAARASFLGRVRVRIGSIDIAPQLSTGGLLLLAALLIEPGLAIARQELSYMLWPDHGRAESRAALRRHLHNLRAVLPKASRPWLRCEGRAIAWNAAADTVVDVADFNRLRRGGRLDDALDIYGGQFLPTVDHEWANGVRDRLHNAAVDLAVRAFSGSPGARGLSDRLRHAARLLALDPFREDAVREIMRERAARGDRAGAVSYYQRFRQQLRDEIGVEPAPETVACYEDVAMGRLPAEFASATSAART